MNKIKRIINKFLPKKTIKIPITKLVDNSKLLSGKTALITGGSGGIGYAIAEELLNSDCNVIITGTNEKKLKKICDNVKNEKLNYIVLNLNDISSFEQKVSEATKKYGKIDILINSAGIHSTNPIQDFFEFSVKEYDEIMNINLKGTYFFTREISKYMIKNKIKGHILMISSSTALEPAWSPYRLSKWGVKGLTSGLADRLYPYGIIVNGIAPGSTATKLLGYEKGSNINTKDNPAKRYIMPEEIAAYAKIMVSDLGNMVIGETLYITGGRGNIYVPTYMNVNDNFWE